MALTRGGGFRARRGGGFRAPSGVVTKRGVAVKVVIKGMKKWQAKQEQVVKDIRGGMMLQGMRDATMIVTRSAKRNAPVDTGRLRASITPAVERLPNFGIRGVVGSNVSYAPYMELGTGTFAGNAPHWPPGAALGTWAHRHGFSSGYQVARIIGMRGGLRPRRYLEKAVTENQSKIRRLLVIVVSNIVEK